MQPFDVLIARKNTELILQRDSWTRIKERYTVAGIE